MADLSNPVAVAKLKPRKAPYSHRVQPKVALLLAVGKRTRTWKSRIPGEIDRAIGPVQDYDFEAARAVVLERLAASRLTPAQAVEAKAAATTIGQAWDRYTTFAAATKTPAACTVIASYGRRIAPLFDMPIASADLADLQAWRDGLIVGGTRTPASANKIVAALRAALNREGIDGPWRKLKRFPAPAMKSAPAEKVLDAAQMRALVSAGLAVDHQFGVLLRGLHLTGARPGELRKAQARDVLVGQSGAVSLLIRFGKTAAKTGDRIVQLSPAGQAFFRDLAAGRDPDAPLFVKSSGEAWGDGDHRRILPRAVADAGLPSAVTLYGFRHGYITAALYAGVPIVSLARSCGTSIEMISKTYAHALADLEAAAFAKLDAAMAGPVVAAI